MARAARASTVVPLAFACILTGREALCDDAGALDAAAAADDGATPGATDAFTFPTDAFARANDASAPLPDYDTTGGCTCNATVGRTATSVDRVACSSVSALAFASFAVRRRARRNART